LSWKLPTRADTKAVCCRLTVGTYAAPSLNTRSAWAQRCPALAGSVICTFLAASTSESSSGSQYSASLPPTLDVWHVAQPKKFDAIG
jgi:hypothetical protein